MANVYWVFFPSGSYKHWLYETNAWLINKAFVSFLLITSTSFPFQELFKIHKPNGWRLSGHKMKRRGSWLWFPAQRRVNLCFLRPKGGTVVEGASKLLQVIATAQLEVKGPQRIIVFTAFEWREESLHVPGAASHVVCLGPRFPASIWLLGSLEPWTYCEVRKPQDFCAL